MVDQESAHDMVSFAESEKILGKRVGEFIEEHFGALITLARYFSKGFGPAETTSYDFLGRPRWRGLWRKRPKIGDVFLAHNKDRWIIQVYGRDHIETMNELARALARKFGKNVHVRLSSEEEDFSYTCDF